jgi:hypothetical protein
MKLVRPSMELVHLKQSYRLRVKIIMNRVQAGPKWARYGIEVSVALVVICLLYDEMMAYYFVSCFVSEV